MEYNKETIEKIEKFIDNYIISQKEKYKDVPAVQDKIEHIRRTVILTKKIALDNDLARVAAKSHDIGRFLQYELLGKFDDSVVLHHNLGEDIIRRAVFKGEIDVSPELDAIRTTIMFHGRTKFMHYQLKISEQAKELVEIVGRVDEIENGCIGALGYLEREAKEDAKSYIKNNPNLDMKQVSPEVLSFYMKGEKFDKLKYCKTYADYVLFANILAITALRGKDREVAKEAMSLECFGYKNAMEGYEDIFKKLIDPKLVNQCVDCMRGFYENPNWKYNDKSESEHE